MWSRDSFTVSSQVVCNLGDSSLRDKPSRKRSKFTYGSDNRGPGVLGLAL